jgi:hypothetical protein
VLSCYEKHKVDLLYLLIPQVVQLKLKKDDNIEKHLLKTKFCIAFEVQSLTRQKWSWNLKRKLSSIKNQLIKSKEFVISTTCKIDDKFRHD